MREATNIVLQKKCMIGHCCREKSLDREMPPTVQQKERMAGMGMREAARLQREKSRQSDDPHRPTEGAHGRDGDEGGGHEGGQVADSMREAAIKTAIEKSLDRVMTPAIQQKE